MISQSAKSYASATFRLFRIDLRKDALYILIRDGASSNAWCIIQKQQMKVFPPRFHGVSDDDRTFLLVLTRPSWEAKQLVSFVFRGTNGNFPLLHQSLLENGGGWKMQKGRAETQNDNQTAILGFSLRNV